MTYRALDILFPNYLSKPLLHCFLSTLNTAEVPVFLTFRKQCTFSPSLIAFVMPFPLFFYLFVSLSFYSLRLSVVFILLEFVAHYHLCMGGL